ncbi:hypothetical protein L083_3667 [Actinoplanes sp. N902-109]|nr:hypothetical protein L083_3667 [Actinoplanes sp. N902-109]
MTLSVRFAHTDCDQPINPYPMSTMDRIQMNDPHVPRLVVIGQGSAA